MKLVPSLSCLVVASACSAPQLSVTPRAMAASIDGDFFAQDQTLVGMPSTKSDLDTLGLDDTEATPSGRLDFKFGVPHLVLHGAQADFSGTGTVVGQLSTQSTAPITGPARSDVTFGTYGGLLLFDVVPTKTVDVEIGIGVDLLDFDFEIVELASGRKVSSDESLPVPVVAGNAEVQLGTLEVGLLVSGMSVSTSDGDGSILDADASLRWKFLGGKNHLRGSLMFGWRQTDLDVDYDDGSDEFEADIGLSGPYFGVQLTL